MDLINNIIKEIFATRWSGSLAHAGIEEQRAKLHKILKNQVEGYWSGHTAYNLAIEGGFLIDSNNVEPKRLTMVGYAFMMDFDPDWKNKLIYKEA